MNIKQLQSMAQLRVSDASFLLSGKCWSAAYYLAGYAVELSLKACISKQFSANTIPDKALVNRVFTHDFDTLIGLAGLRPQITERLKADTEFAASWSICKEWTPEARYVTWYEPDALALHIAITDETFGVMPWIKRFW
jgi:hypothetical protein